MTSPSHEALTETVAAHAHGLRQQRARVDAAIAGRDQAIRDALAARVPYTVLIEATGLTRAGLNRIRQAG